MLRDYITEERVKDRVTSTTTENITAQEHISMRQNSAGLGYKVYLRGRITRYNDRVHLHARITGFIYTVELHKHTSINNTN